METPRIGVMRHWAGPQDTPERRKDKGEIQCSNQ